MIYVIASLEIQAGKRDAYLAEFAKVAPKVHEEDGCIAYDATVDVRTDIDIQKPYRPNTVTIMEQWESLEALGAHLRRRTWRSTSARRAMVVGRELQVLEPA